MGKEEMRGASKELQRYQGDANDFSIHAGVSVASSDLHI